MIHGIGTDLVAVARIRDALERHGERFARRILAGSELDEFVSARDPARFLAKRFAAKEAFGKAYGTGVAVPATLHSVIVAYDARGRPVYRYDGELARCMAAGRWQAHLSLSDEQDHALAFAVIEAP